LSSKAKEDFRFQSTRQFLDSFSPTCSLLRLPLRAMVCSRRSSLLMQLILFEVNRQALLWEGYNLASQPESSLLAETVRPSFRELRSVAKADVLLMLNLPQEKSATFATVLSLALTIKPVSDLVCASFLLLL